MASRGEVNGSAVCAGPSIGSGAIGITTQVVALQSAGWDVRTIVSVAASFGWDVRIFVSAVQSFQWHIAREKVTAYLTAHWNTQAATVDDEVTINRWKFR